MILLNNCQFQTRKSDSSIAPFASSAVLLRTQSPIVRTSLSSRIARLDTSECPNQYTRGRREDDPSATGAEEAALPSGEAGDQVWIGSEMGHADRVPGTAKPPYLMRSLAQYIREKRRFTSLVSRLARMGVQPGNVRTP